MHNEDNYHYKMIIRKVQNFLKKYNDDPLDLPVTSGPGPTFN